MPLSKPEVKKILRSKMAGMESCINSIEEQLNVEDEEFKKHKIAFHFGRLQELYQEIYSLQKESGWI